MVKFESKIAIFGAGGFGKETLCYLIDCLMNTNRKIEEVAVFVVDDEWYKMKTVIGIPVIPRSEFIAKDYHVLVAVGDPFDRKKIVDSLPIETKYLTLIHPRATVSKFVILGDGTIIAPGAVVSCDTKLGKHAHINYNSTIGHDCIIGDFFTAGPGVNISGNCILSNGIYFGANSSVRERITICKDVTIGMGTIVVKDILEEGTYIGNPARKLEK